MWKFIFLGCLIFSLCACGGSGENVSGTGAVQKQTLSGTASQGAALTGIVSVKDVKGTERTSIIGIEGAFTLDVSEMSAPYLLTAGSLYSFANGIGIVNINPFTDLAVKNAAETTDMATVYGSSTLSAMKLREIQSKIQNSVIDINLKMDPIYKKYSITTPEHKNFMNGSIFIGHNMDAMFDTFKVTISSAGSIALKTKNGSAPIFTATINLGLGTMNIQYDLNFISNLPPTLVVGTTTPRAVGDYIEMKKGINFPHKKHQEILKDCSKCHEKGPGKIEGFGKDWAHKTCKGCHTEKAQGPTACMDCHKTTPTPTPTPGALGDYIEMKKGVNFAHKKHQEILKDCSKCHEKGPGKIEGFGKDWAHKTCKGCHTEKAQGPTSCKECHK